MVKLKLVIVKEKTQTVQVVIVRYNFLKILYLKHKVFVNTSNYVQAEIIPHFKT